MSPETLAQLPAVNAGLNSLATLFLLGAGYAIKVKGDEDLHKKLMMTAFGISSAFLAIYLYYHAQVGHVVFKGEGLVKIIYMAILFPHIIMAVGVLPLIFLAIKYAIQGEKEKHKKMVKWAYPIWLYVAVSGVVIYFMVFHLYA